MSYRLDENLEFDYMLNCGLFNRWNSYPDPNNSYLMVSRNTLNIYPFAIYIKTAMISQTGEMILVASDLCSSDNYPYYFEINGLNRRYFDSGNCHYFYSGNHEHPSLIKDNYDFYVLEYECDWEISGLIQLHIDRARMLGELSK